jgi:predicted metal-dependent hydrolase
MFGQKIILKNTKEEKVFFYNIKNSLKSKNLKIKIIDEKNLDIILPKKSLLNKIIFSNFCPEEFLKKNKDWIFKNTEIFFNLKKEKLFLKDWRESKESFLKIAEKKVLEFNKFYNFSYGKINIRDQKSRWGSCSGKGNLNFNYRVFLLPESEMDYVVVHEICHLKEMNHSKNFWDLVGKKSPDYKKIRQGLKKYTF